MKVEQQRHGYVGGHQLLATSAYLDPQDQTLVDRLSDIGGQPGPNESVPAYLTGYPLPSGKFYAFARTWYDETAPRAGCVLTHTLLVPTAEWAALRSLLPLVVSHEWFPRELTSRSLSQLSVPDLEREPYPEAHAKGLAELCEAVFLEERRPIVWLTEPDERPVLRLVEALWPALRTRFAFQTYALKPRSKASGLFDLMVAPRSARSRFSAWEGRRIDGDAPARHAFTPMIVNAIFRAPYPDLEPVDPLGVLARDQVGDPAKLRLSILWNNLRASSADPNTMLGMLDVLSAAALPRKNRWKLAKPLFENIFELACSGTRRAGNVVEIALGKLDPGDGARLTPSISRSVKCLMEPEPEVALRLAASIWRDTSVMPVLRQAAAESLTDMPAEKAWMLLRTAPRPLLSELIEIAPGLVPLLASHPSSDRTDWAWFAGLLMDLDQDTFDRLWLPLLGQIKGGAQAPLMTVLLQQAPVGRLSEALRRLSKSGALQDPSLIAIFGTLKGSTPRERLDAVVGAYLPASQVQPIYDVMLEPKLWAIDWVLGADLPARLRISLLTDLLGRMSGSDRAAFLSGNRDQFDRVIAVLFAADAGVNVAVELIEETPHLSAASFELALSQVGQQRTEGARRVLASLIERLTPLDSETSASLLERVLAAPLSASAVRVVAPSIFELLMPARTQDFGLTYSLGLQVATNLPQTHKKGILENLALIPARISDYRAYKLSPQAYLCWAKLLTEALSTTPRAAASAADSALEYVLRRDPDAALPLARVSFPVVFRSVFGTSKKSQRRAEDLTIKILRIFIRKRWDGVVFLLMLLETGQPAFGFDAALHYSYESKRFIEDAARRLEEQVASQGGLPVQEGSHWADDDLDYL